MYETTVRIFTQEMVNTDNLYSYFLDMQPYTRYNASVTVCTEVGCTTSTNVSIMMPESLPEGKQLHSPFKN